MASHGGNRPSGSDENQKLHEFEQLTHQLGLHQQQYIQDVRNLIQRPINTVSNNQIYSSMTNQPYTATLPHSPVISPMRNTNPAVPKPTLHEYNHHAGELPPRTRASSYRNNLNNIRPQYQNGRTIIQPRQLEILHREFSVNDYLGKGPEGKTRTKQLSEKTGLPEKTIAIWFNNKRTRNKKTAEANTAATVANVELQNPIDYSNTGVANGPSSYHPNFDNSNYNAGSHDVVTNANAGTGGNYPTVYNSNELANTSAGNGYQPWVAPTTDLGGPGETSTVNN